MFLFTTPPVRDAAPANPVVDAIRSGAERTGTDFDQLLATAQRESALDPAAKAKGSSASGLFQFIEQTWLGTMKADGAKLGLADQASAISARSDGTFAVDDPAARQAILNLRNDPKVASVMAGALTQRNRDTLAAELGREPSRGDLYIAHFLGGRGAGDLIRAAQQNPTRPAASDFPDAAAANRSIFFDRSGRARGAGEVYALLATEPSSAGKNAAPAFAPDRPVAFARPDGPAFHGFFQTDNRRGPISDAVARVWRGGSANPPAIRTAALGGFFPRADGAPSGEAASQAAAPSDTEASPALPVVTAPLPPSRPAELGAASARPRSGVRRTSGPLDLGAFMKWRKA